jgi:hypothetical protein
MYRMIPRLDKSQRLSYDQLRSSHTSTTFEAIKSAEPTGERSSGVVINLLLLWEEENGDGQ